MKFGPLNELLLALLFFVACEEDEKFLNKTDPYWQSFWGTNISTMTEMNCKDSTCTTFYPIMEKYYFDEVGNMIGNRSFGTNFVEFDTMSYNSQRFLTRLFIVTFDTYYNECYDYKWFKAEKRMLQYCYRLESRDWKYDPTEIDSSKANVIEYIFDEKGRIIEIVDSMRSNTTQFEYQNNLLIKKQESYRSEVRYSWDYAYSGDKLERIKWFIPGGIVVTYYFSEKGVLDYSIEETPTISPTYKKYVVEYRQ